MPWKPNDPPENPFAVAGVPTFIGGRFEQRQSQYEWVKDARRQPFVAVGVRGSGKTTLANWVARLVTDELDLGVEVAYVRGDNPRPFMEQIQQPAHRSSETTYSAGVKFFQGTRSKTTADRLQNNLVGALPQGAYIVVDEAQRVSQTQLTELAEYMEAPADNGMGKVLLVGTPALLDRFSDVSGTYGMFGRCPRAHIPASQSLDEVADIIVGTIEETNADVTFTDAAIERLHHFTDGYPPAVQAYAMVSVRRTRNVDRSDVDNAHPRAQLELRGTYQQMLNRQGGAGRPPAGRVAALQILANGPTTSSHIARTLNKSSGTIAAIRNDLIDSGLITIDNDSRWHLAISNMRYGLAARQGPTTTQAIATPTRELER